LKLFRLFVAAVAIALPALTLHAQNFPNKPVRIVVPFPPGGAVDAFARMIAPLMSENLGQPVLIENRGGAGGTVGAGVVAQSQPDGYTLLMVYDTHAVAPVLYPKQSFDQNKDLAPVSLLATVPLVLLTSTKVPASNLTEFATFAKSRPDGLNYSSGGSGSSGHLTAELVKRQLGIAMTHVPYKGGGPALAAVVSNEVDMTFLGTMATVGFVKSGRVKALAVMGKRRAPLLADVPTIAELGHPTLEAISWYGILVPTGTPPAAVTRVSEALSVALNNAGVRQRLQEQGGEIIGSTPEYFARFLQDETRKWGRVVHEAGIKVD
jgi:tripartite-type tricarboxylate transporter receptor subunit TctC